MHIEGIFHKQLLKGHKHEKGSRQDKDEEDKNIYITSMKDSLHDSMYCNSTIPQCYIYSSFA